MAIKIPVRTVFDGSNNAIGLSEFQSGDAIGIAHGGLGLSSLGSAHQVLKVNASGNALEFVNDSELTPDTYLQVANANITFLGKNASAALTGDVTGTANFSSNAISIATNIAASGTPTGTFGSSSKIPVIVVAADGRITGISNVAVAAVANITYATSNGLFTINTSDGASSSVNITSVPDDPMPTGDYGALTADFQTLGDEINSNNHFDAQLPKGGINTEDLGGIT